MARSLRLGNEAWQAAITSGEMYPAVWISQREGLTRELDKRSWGNPGSTMPRKINNRRRGADPPKNASGRTTVVPSYENRTMCQNHKWLEHHSGEFFQRRYFHIENDLGDAMTVLQCRNDVF